MERCVQFVYHVTFYDLPLQDYKRALDSLEERQDKMFSRIKQLQETIMETGRDVGLSSQELQRLTEVSHNYTCTCTM